MAPKSKEVLRTAPVPKGRPAATPEAREAQMIALAENLAERQLLDGTASSQVITHYLKLGTKKAELDLTRLEHENELLKVKAESIKASQRTEELYAEAIKAMRRYTGEEPISEEPGDDYDNYR